MLFGMLQDAERDSAARPALAGTESKLSYKQLVRATDTVSRVLQEHGVDAGCRISLRLDDPLQFTASFFAAARLGAVVVLDPPRNETGPKVFTPPNAQFVVVPAVGSRPRWRNDRSNRVATIEIHPPQVDRLCQERVARHDRRRQSGPVLADCYLPGNEEVVRDQSNLAHESTSLVEALGMSRGDRVLCLMPANSPLGLHVGLLPAIAARASVIFNVPDDAHEMGLLLRRYRPSIIVGELPTLERHMAHHESVLAAARRTRVILAPRSAALPQIMEARAGFLDRLVTFYYRAETGVVALNGHGGPADCVGKLLPGTRVILEQTLVNALARSEQNRNFGSFLCLRSLPRVLLDEAPVEEPGVPGHIVIESPATAPALTCNGRLYTREKGYFDRNGELHLLPSQSTQEPMNRCA